MDLESREKDISTSQRSSERLRGTCFMIIKNTGFLGISRQRWVKRRRRMTTFYKKRLEHRRQLLRELAAFCEVVDKCSLNLIGVQNATRKFC